MGRKERQRLGVANLSEAELESIMEITDPAVLEIRRPKNVWINAVIALGAIALLVWGGLPSAIIFMIGTVLTLVINYPSVKEQKARIDGNAAEANQVVMTVFAAGVFMGILQASGMSDVIANSLLNIIPESWSLFYGLIVALISIPGTYFLNNDAFFYGVLPVIAEAGLSYGFTPLQLTFASLMGQAFHLLSPLVPFVYVLLGMTEVEMGPWQKKAGLISIGIFITYVIVGALLGIMPIFIG